MSKKAKNLWAEVKSSSPSGGKIGGVTDPATPNNLFTISTGALL